MNTKIILPLCIIIIILVTAFAFHWTQSFYKVSAQGERYFQESKYQQALPYFISAFKMKSNDMKIAGYLLHSYVKIGMQKEARDVLEVIWRNNPEDLVITEWLADSYYSLLDYPKAEELYRRTMVQKDNNNIKRKLAEVLVWQKKYNEAIPIIENLIKATPGDYKLMELLADVYSWEKEYDKSIELYKKLISSGFHSKELVLKLAEVLRFSGRNDEASELYKKYLVE